LVRFHCKHVIFILLITAFCLPFFGGAETPSDRLVLEWEQHWETYGVGGTCNFGTHNFFVGDVDSDGVLEMITGGIMYYVSDDTRTGVEAPFRIWNWNGQSFKLEASENWAGAIASIYAADSDGDGLTEIILGGMVANTTGSYASLRLMSWTGEVLTLRASYEGISVNSIFVSDVDKDGGAEILTVGRVTNDNKSSAQLAVWQWDGTALVLKKTVEWGTADGAIANSVYAVDLNNDGEVEIVTGGYTNGLKNSRAQICVWHWNGEVISLEKSEEWFMVEEGYGVDIAGNPLGNTVINNLKSGDVDGDGTLEIVTGGFTYDAEKINAQLRIWNWSGTNLMLEKSYEWATEDITEVKSISIDDVDGDGYEDVVTSGFVGVYGGFSDENTPPEQAQLRIWSWNGEVVTLRIEKDWTIGDGVTGWNIGTGDVDGDGAVEIVTVGCMYEATLCDPDLRIWSLSREPTQLPYILFSAVTIVILTLIVTAFFFARKKTRKGFVNETKR